MARRVPLPRLTQRQRMTRWQRERRQQAIVVTIFGAVLVFVLGLAAWAAAQRYYEANLAPAAKVAGVEIPKRDYRSQLDFELIRLYQAYGVPAGFENDPQLESAKAAYRELALDRVVERAILDRAAREAGIALSQERLDEQYQIEFGEFNVRHILIQIPADAEDKEKAAADARAEAQRVAEQLRKAPNDQDLWNKLASEHSDDPGSKESGGELGFAGSGSYVAEFDEAMRTLKIGEVSEPIRTVYGFHVLQVKERRAPGDTDLVKRYLAAGFTEQRLREAARYEALRKEFAERQYAAAPSGSAPQAHIAKIVVNIPRITATNFREFASALDKQSQVRKALEEGKDFAQIAKENSDDRETADKGGDAGWVARGMIVDPKAEDIVFATEAGKTTEPVSTASEWIVYKVLEKSGSREVTEEQRSVMKQRAYQYWYARQQTVYDVVRYGPL